MTGPLSALGRHWADLVDSTLAWQAQLLRRAGSDLADALDRSARLDIEGATEWRDLNPRENRYAG